MALNADAGDKAKLRGKPSNANDMQAIKQSGCGKRCEMQKAMQGVESETNEQKTMQYAENEAKARCKTKARARQHA